MTPQSTGNAAGPAAPLPVAAPAGRPLNPPDDAGECLTPGYGAAAAVTGSADAAVAAAVSAGADSRPPGVVPRDVRGPVRSEPHESPEAGTSIRPLPGTTAVANLILADTPSAGLASAEADYAAHCPCRFCKPRLSG